MKREDLETLVSERLTIRQIAERLGTSQTNVRYWLRKHDLQTCRGPHGKIQEGELPFKCKCGETDKTKFYTSKRFICKRCSNQQTIEAGRRKRDRMIEYLGGKCKRCGYDKPFALDVHHLDPAIKSTSWRSSRGWSWEKIQKELDSCTLLCKNCHSEQHTTGISLGARRRFWEPEAVGSTPAYPTNTN